MRAVVIGAGGAIGRALAVRLAADPRVTTVHALSRDPPPSPERKIEVGRIDVTREDSIAAAAAVLDAPLDLILIATGLLHEGDRGPERALKALDAAWLARSFAINAIGPALVMKHFVPLLPRQGRCVIAALSARVGSISDNRLGGWYAYRASKAALNQLVRTAAIELRRTRPEAICLAMHPGTVATGLSGPFAKTGLDVQQPAEAAAKILAVIDGLTVDRSGTLVDQNGVTIPF